MGKQIQFYRGWNKRISILFEPRDLWIGVYWDRHVSKCPGWNVVFFVCIVPMFPIKVEWGQELAGE